jgi:transposase IS66-like protein
MFTLIETAKLNDVDPQAWVTDVRAGSTIARPPGSLNCSPAPSRQPPPEAHQRTALAGWVRSIMSLPRTLICSNMCIMLH